ncbi:hypothetical protein IAI18_10710 [Acetobacteraceae bacterium H6797]|nr:hypothetical protein [Acetobacteraceae bacterium H6797]
MSENYPNLAPGYSPPSKEESLRNLTLVIHLLYVAGLFTGIASIAGVVIAYFKRADAAGTIYASHFTYAIRTFWIGLILGFVGWLLTFILIGFVLLPLFWVWFVIRVVRVMLAWQERRPIEKPEAFF